MQRRAIHTGRAVSDDTRWESAWTADDGLAPSPLSVLWLTDDPAVIYSLVWGDPPRLVEIDALTARARRDVAVRSSFDRPWPWAHPVKAVPLAPRHAVVATFDGYVLVLDLDTAEVTRVLGALGGPAERVQTSRDGQTIVAATAAQYTRLWSPAHGDKPARIAADAGAALSPDGQTLAWTPYSEDAETAPHGVVFASSAHLPGGARTVVRDSPRSLCLAFDADEHHLWSADEDGQLRRYLLTKNSPSVALGSHAGAVREILPCDPGGAMVVHDADGLLRVSADGAPPARVLKAREGERVIPSRDGRRALRVRAGEFRLVDTETGDVREYLSGHARAVRAAAFSPDGKLLATGSDDFTVRVWDARTGECVWCLEGHDDSVHGLAFAPDGERLYSVDARGTLRQWSLTQGAEIASLALPQDYARVRPGGLRVSPDGSQACVMRGAGSGRGLCEVDLLAWAPFAQRWVKFIAADARYTPDASALVAVGCDYGVYPRNDANATSPHGRPDHRQGRPDRPRHPRAHRRPGSAFAARRLARGGEPRHAGPRVHAPPARRPVRLLEPRSSPHARRVDPIVGYARVDRSGRARTELPRRGPARRHALDLGPHPHPRERRVPPREGRRGATGSVACAAPDGRSSDGPGVRAG